MLGCELRIEIDVLEHLVCRVKSQMLFTAN
jgi:hypothetical protein